MKPSNVWHGHSTRPSLPAGTARKGNGHLSGRGPSICCCKTVRSLQSPTGAFIAALRKHEFALAGRTGSSYPRQKKKQSVPDCWVSVKQFSRNDTATACQDWLRSTRLGRGSIKSHVRTVKVLGMGLFAFQERVHLWKGVTH